MDPHIGLITDFGLRGSHYVASMKGVIATINPKINIIDISHSVKHFSIIEAAYLIKSTYSYFPEGTVFVAVIDPGVGSEREIVALSTKDGYRFVGPDNGIFLGALESQITDCYLVNNEEYFHKPVSNTFHGRDIMAPVGAHIASGLPLKQLGPSLAPTQLKKLPLTYEINEKEKEISCSIQYVDDFGNLTTNIKIENKHVRNSEFSLEKKRPLTLITDNDTFRGQFVTHFAMVPENNLLFIKGSTGFLEISLNQGHASDFLGISSGDVIIIKF